MSGPMRRRAPIKPRISRAGSLSVSSSDSHALAPPPRAEASAHHAARSIVLPYPVGAATSVTRRSRAAVSASNKRARSTYPGRSGGGARLVPIGSSTIGAGVSGGVASAARRRSPALSSPTGTALAEPGGRGLVAADRLLMRLKSPRVVARHAPTLHHCRPRHSLLPGTVRDAPSPNRTAIAEGSSAAWPAVVPPQQEVDDTSMRLTSTLQVYLEENSSRARAAKRMGVHEKTISCRVKQAQEILERDLDGDTLGRGP